MFNHFNNISKTNGIYKITNIINGKFYIGSSVNCNLRCKTHLRNLLQNKHINSKLQNSWNTYGKDNFNFEILESIDSSSKLLEREQYYLDTLKPEYNICKIAGNTLGVKPSKSVKQKISISLTDKYSGSNSFNYNGGYNKPKNKLETSSNIIYPVNIKIKSRQEIESGKIVVRYDSNMLLIDEWDSIKKASDTLKISRNGIKRCCVGKDRHAGFFIWRFKGQEDIIYKFRSNPILQMNIDNEIISEYDQIVIAAEKLKINRKYIGEALKNGKTYCGFYWKYKNETKCHTHIEK